MRRPTNGEGNKESDVSIGGSSRVNTVHLKVGAAS